MQEEQHFKGRWVTNPEVAIFASQNRNSAPIRTKFGLWIYINRMLLGVVNCCYGLIGRLATGRKLEKNREKSTQTSMELGLRKGGSRNSACRILRLFAKIASLHVGIYLSQFLHGNPCYLGVSQISSEITHFSKFNIYVINACRPVLTLHVDSTLIGLKFLFYSHFRYIQQLARK